MTTPALRALRKNFPHAEISILSKPWVAPVFENSPHVNHLLLYDEKGRHGALRGKFRLARELRSGDFDAAILLQNAFEAAFISFFAGIPVRAGYDTDARKLLLTHPVPCTPEIKEIHQTGYYLGILEGLGLQTDGQHLELAIRREDRQRAAEILHHRGIAGERKKVGINPGATFGTAKRWFPERYAELCRRIRDNLAADILVFGGPGEASLGEHICQMAGKGCVNLSSRTSLREAMALIETCHLFITNDSGLMHVAAALDVPQIAIFGSTDHITTAPASPKSRIVRVPTRCSPCLKPECPEGHHRCMKDITVDMVYSGVSEMVNSEQ
jgi:heptosyltransferase-2